MTAATLHVLEPPYDGPVPAGAFRPAVGALGIVDLAGGIPALARAVTLTRDAPWCPLVAVVSDRGIAAATLEAFEPIPGTWGILYPSDYAHLSLERRVQAVVRRRPVPLTTTIAQWVEARLHMPGSASTLAACFGEGGDALRPPRTLTRRVQALGPLEVRDWRGIGRLAQSLMCRPLQGLTLEGMALDALIDPRTLRRWLRLATDLPWAEVAARVGWEWVLESALRKWSYVERREIRRVSGGVGVVRGEG